MSESGRAAAHVRAARLLDQDDAELDTVAAHLLLAERTAEEWVVGKLRTAAQAALNGALRIPRRLPARALEERRRRGSPRGWALIRV